MKLYPEKLHHYLKEQAAKPTTRCYIISGDEPLLIQESCDLVRHALRQQGYTERELFHAEEGFKWQEVLYSANSMSLFAEKKLIEVRMSSRSPGDAGRALLVSLVEELNEATALLLVMPRIDAATQKTKWFKSIERVGVFMQVWPIEAKQFPDWLQRRFKREGLEVTREALLAMARRTEGNLLAAVQEIERLKLISPDKHIDLEEVTDGVADSARYDVFKLIDASLAGQSPRVVRMIQGLRLEGTAEMYVNVMLARELRLLETMATAMDQGQTVQEVLRRGRVWDKRKQAVSRCLDRHGAQSLRRLQLMTGKIDRVIKGLEPGDAWREITNLLLGLAGIAVLSEQARGKS